MDEAAKVLTRLDRIESLRAGAAPARVLLGEVRALLDEAEQWVRAEGAGARAERAVGSVRDALANGENAGWGGERTLVA